jgi:hypothetical protein
VMINPLEYHRVCGGGADDCVEWRGRTGGSYMSLRFSEPHRRALCGPHATKEKSVVPPRWCRVILHTPMRLGNRVPPRRGCLWWLRRRWSLLGEKTCSFLPWLQHSCSQIYAGFSTGNKVHKYYFGVWTLNGIRMCFVAWNKRGGWLSLRWFRTTN